MRRFLWVALTFLLFTLPHALIWPGDHGESRGPAGGNEAPPAEAQRSPSPQQVGEEAAQGPEMGKATNEEA